MRIAVLTLTRDRLAYTQHCFQTLREYAGCEFDHFVFDNGSQDDTVEWLHAQPNLTAVQGSSDNVGISRGLNALLDAAGPDYDVYVKFDNDCELTTPATLKVAAKLVHERGDWILSPRIVGLDSPPAVERTVALDGSLVGELGLIGGIFMAVPGWVYKEFRYDNSNPIWGMDDASLGSWFRGKGGKLGYLLAYPANHYLTTRGQWADPEQLAYYKRKAAEFAH